MQLALVPLLYAQLANVLRAAVIALFIAFFQLFFFFLIDAPYVAHHMAGQVTKGVIAEQARFDFYARKTKVLCGELGHLFVSQPRTDGQ